MIPIHYNDQLSIQKLHYRLRHAPKGQAARIQSVSSIHSSACCMNWKISLLVACAPPLKFWTTISSASYLIGRIDLSRT